MRRITPPCRVPRGGSLVGSSGTIKDADDICTSVNKTSTQQVSLHQAVFPQHGVVGWYRVINEGPVTQEDVRITQELQQHYGENNNNKFVFLLLQVNTSTTEQELPLSIYQLSPSSPILVEIPQKWQLATLEPERIAMERIVREQPNTDGQADKESKFATHVGTVEQALLAMKERVQILIQYLQQVQQAPSSKDLQLLREIQALVYQLGPLNATSGTIATSENTELLSHLASVAKMTCAIQGYTDKIRTLYDSRNPSVREGAASRRF